MLSGFYSAATGMVTQGIALNHMTDNIVNAMVPGYKKQEVLFHSFDEDLASEVSKMGPFAQKDVASGIDIIQNSTNFSQGQLRYSGQNTDVAIEGDGFFAIDTGNGVYYSRNGTFRISNENELVTKDGYKVLNAGGDGITLDTTIPSLSSTLGVEDDGTVYCIDNTSKPERKVIFGKIGISKFSNPEKLERVGYSLWKNNEEDNAGIMTSDAKLQCGYVEMANVSPVESMVDMVYNQRLFDANANILKALQSNLEDYIRSVVD